MKYMGSKNTMLLNGLGSTIAAEIKSCNRVVDLFSGSSSVSWYIAQKYKVPVIAVDLQQYSMALGNSILRRTESVSSDNLWNVWENRFLELTKNCPLFDRALEMSEQELPIDIRSNEARELCKDHNGSIIWNSYGGYYFSPFQAITIDLLIKSIPFSPPISYISLASIIISASKCAASPGHTAQPFKPNETAGPYLEKAWDKDILKYVKSAFKSISNKSAKKKGKAIVGSAFDYISKLKNDDLVFIDPPYSSVQYSRFYHVLETIARGSCGEVNGTGRYPPFNERPVSSFSRKSESEEAFEELIKEISKQGSKVIITYPDKECSNGLSGEAVYSICAKYFNPQKKTVSSVFSTMGGNNKTRSSRKKTSEMILVLDKST